ncbi:MAG: ABC transporter ATP-binding protein [Clostridiales bacterium]|nr:ABC transporter ATP-binding protein [Clostridiales bacterium]
MIEVSNLTQTYRSGKGVFDLNFTIKEGEVFGYLGPNGAGKTTTIRNLLGFTNADKGTCTIKGIDCRKDAAKLQNMIGFLPGEMAFLPSMTGMQFLKFMSDMRKTKNKKRRDELIELFELDPSPKIKKMSKGMKQKLGIITAFMHDPEIYILDEPTSGLDPLMQNVFMDLIEQEHANGKTIMMSSHIFEEVQKSCDRACIIREGKIVATEEIKSLEVMKQKAYVVTFESQDGMKKFLQSKLQTETIASNKARIFIDGDYTAMFKELAKYNIKGFESQQQSIEDVFMKYYGKDGEGA